jgi:hypothetical protein
MISRAPAATVSGQTSAHPHRGVPVRLLTHPPGVPAEETRRDTHHPTPATRRQVRAATSCSTPRSPPGTHPCKGAALAVYPPGEQRITSVRNRLWLCEALSASGVSVRFRFVLAAGARPHGLLQGYYAQSTSPESSVVAGGVVAREGGIVRLGGQDCGCEPSNPPVQEVHLEGDEKCVF